jgi:hypothetical protein
MQKPRTALLIWRRSDHFSLQLKVTFYCSWDHIYHQKPREECMPVYWAFSLLSSPEDSSSHYYMVFLSWSTYSRLFLTDIFPDHLISLSDTRLWLCSVSRIESHWVLQKSAKVKWFLYLSMCGHCPTAHDWFLCLETLKRYQGREDAGEDWTRV